MLRAWCSIRISIPITWSTLFSAPIQQTLESLAYAKQNFFTHLRANQNVVPEAQRKDAQVEAEMLRDVYLSRTAKALNTSFLKDKDFYGVSPTLETNLRPKLDAYSRSGNDLIATLSGLANGKVFDADKDRKSTRLNSSH